MADLWDTLGEKRGWNPCFLRPLTDWEVDLAGHFIGTIQGKKVILEMEDRVTWKENKNGNFIVRSLSGILESRGVSLFPHKIIWNSWLPPKVGFFAWETSWGKVLTLDNLKRKG